MSLVLIPLVVLPGLGIWLLGLVFSIIGVRKAPRGSAIAGLIISGISLISFIFLMMRLFD